MEAFTDILLKILAAFVISAIIGYERASGKKSAGIRTHTIVCMTTALLMIAASESFTPDSVSRIIQGIITGIGFLGSGAILVQHNKPHEDTIIGLTTAATLWSVAVLGVMVGLGRILEAGLAGIFIFIILELHRLDEKVAKR